MRNYALADGAKRVIQLLTERAGFRISRIHPGERKQILDLRHITTDPIEAVYRAGSSQSSVQNSWVVICVPIERLRSYPMGFAKDSQYTDPFAETVRNFLSRSCVGFEGSVLEGYFRGWRPRNAAELLGLDPGKANDELLERPPFGAVCPWDFDHPEKRAQANNPGSEGWQHCGPVTVKKGQEEFGRYQRVADAINRDGYRRNTHTIDGDIAGQVLLRGSEWRILICDGMHRFAALQALGWSTIPICLRRWPMLIRREEALSWPNVANALFDVNCATEFFDQLFDAKQPSTYQGLTEE